MTDGWVVPELGLSSEGNWELLLAQGCQGSKLGVETRWPPYTIAVVPMRARTWELWAGLEKLDG